MSNSFSFILIILLIITILLIVLKEPVIPLTFPCNDIIPMRQYENPSFRNVSPNYWGLTQPRPYSI